MAVMLVVRHGESTWNAEDRWTGQADPPLSPGGRASARELGFALTGAGFTAIVSSDLRRAQETAEILASELGLPAPVSVADLRERDVGLWTGRTGAEIDREWPGWRERWRTEELAELPGGEPREAFDRRIVAALVDLAHGRDGQRLLVVAHAGTLRALERHCATVIDRRNLDGVWITVEGDHVRCEHAAPTRREHHGGQDGVGRASTSQ